MTSSPDPGLLTFASNLMESHGALLEQEDKRILSLLPPELARFLNAPEEILLGGENYPLLYGSPFLDSLIRLATHDVPVLYARLNIPYLKKDGFDRLVSEDVQLFGARIKSVAQAEANACYMVVICHYRALSDERKEGLVQVPVSESTGSVIEGLEELWKEFPFEAFPDSRVPPQFDLMPEQALTRAIDQARGVTQEELSTFFSGMRRRLYRDVRNTREYYQALAVEMEQSLSHHNLTEAQREDRRAKIAELPKEMNAKIGDLERKYSLKVTITGRAALRLLVPVVRLMVQINCRKISTTVSLTWNPVTRRLDPIRCDRCGGGSLRIYADGRDTTVRLLCPMCNGSN
ncbi:MAG: hypothetical protein RDU20_04645 [Desulfomonilaceae bacterium]|nr:hypothetical protein [Desulfomonilaceae bacterium]